MMPQLLSVLPKAIHWCRIGLALRRLKRVDVDERVHAQQALTLLLGQARGLAMKMGQIMAGCDDNNPYQALVVSAEPLPLKIIKRNLVKHLNQPLEQVFRSIDESTAAASLGQVHHAVLHGGVEVAVKIRYPGIVEAVKAELALSDRLPDAGPVRRWRFNASDYKSTLRRQLLRETDYRIEMQTQQRFRHNLRVPGLYIPDVYSGFCGDAVLIQSWETGCRFGVACTWSKKDRLEIGRTLLMTLFQSLFVHGEVHGDPHPGNYLFRHDADGNPQTVLLDFGCTVQIGEECRLALLKLLDSRQSSRACDPIRCFAAMGFDTEKLGHLQEKMPEICDLLFRPFWVERPFDVRKWRLSEALKALLDEQRWWFRAAGPAQLMLLLRAFHGICQQLEKLDVALPWWPLLKHVAGDHLLEQARTLALPAVVKLPAAGGTRQRSARKLCVRMTENGVIHISADLPAEAAFDLDSIIPGPVMSMLLSGSEINFSELTRRLRREGLMPQELFNATIAARRCRVWLE